MTNQSTASSQLIKAERFRIFVEPEIPVLLRVARALTGNSIDAEDLVQETLIKALGAIERFDGASPRAWLQTIMRNAWHNSFRKKQPSYVGDWNLVLNSKPAFHAEVPRSAEEEALRGITDPILLNALSTLSEDFRSALILIDVEGFSYAEAAEILGIPIGTIMSRRSRARAKIRKQIVESRERTRNE